MQTGGAVAQPRLRNAQLLLCVSKPKQKDRRRQGSGQVLPHHRQLRQRVSLRSNHSQGRTQSKIVAGTRPPTKVSASLWKSEMWLASALLGVTVAVAW
jgi:hypothetical protein